MPDKTRIVTNGPSGLLVTESGEKVRPPENWLLLPPGDAALTRRVKQLGPHWLIQEKKGRRVFSKGVWASKITIEKERAKLDEQRATPAFQKQKEASRKRRENLQKQYVSDFTEQTLSYLNFHKKYSLLAEKLAQLVSDHATPVSSGTVARTTRIPVEKRAEAAVIAWLRHQTTGYDRMTIARVKGMRRQVRRQLAERSSELLERYRAGEKILNNCPLQAALAKLED